MVMQEWWGLVPQIKTVCDRLAGEGFVALAPDLYRGDIAEHTEMDKAAAADVRRCRRIAPRATWAARSTTCSRTTAVHGDKVGVVGFCMGGMLALVVAAQQGDKIGAAASVLRRAARRRRARLVGPHRAGARATSPRTTTSSRPTRSRRSRRSCREWARTSSSRSIPAPATRS